MSNSTEMVELVARAIHEAYEREHEHVFDVVPWERTTERRREWVTSLACAAIEAMREPTADMLRAGMDLPSPPTQEGKEK